MANIEQFKVLSHITTLQTATTDKIQKNGGRAALVKDMRNSVIQDVLGKQLPVAIDESRKRQQRFQAWREEAEAIDAEFNTLN